MVKIQKYKKLRCLISLGLMTTMFSPMTAFAMIDSPGYGPTESTGKAAFDMEKFADELDVTRKKEKDETSNSWEDSKQKASSINVTPENLGAAKGAYGAASGGASEMEGQVDAIKGDVDSTRAKIQEEAASEDRMKADAPDTPALKGNSALSTNATDSDNKIIKNVAGAKLSVLKISDDGKTVENADNEEDDDKKNNLAAINQKIMEQVAAQQENQTSNNGTSSYQVQTSTGETVVVTKNPCYQKTTDQACMQNYSYSWTDENGNRQTSQVPLSTIEYLAGSTKVTYDMIQQARRQEEYTNATKNVLSNNGASSSLQVNPIETVTSSVRDMVAYGADPNEAIMSGLLAYVSQVQSADTIRDVKKYSQGMQDIQKAKDDAVYALTEEVQQQNGVLSSQKNKRFRPRLIPSIPVINSDKPIMVSLITPSGIVNDESEYTVKARVKNQKTGKIQTFNIRENTPFIVELPEWTTKTGRRNVEIIYEFTNSAVKETYSFSYKVGQMATAILPNGKAVSNSVTALASNKDILNYNMTGQAVAGRIKDYKWDNGMCFLEITDAKDDSNLKYPSVVVATDKVEESVCGSNLKGKYISMGNVTAKYDDNGQYIYVDNSDGDQVSIMNESGYDSLEDGVAAQTQYEGDKWDKNTLKVGKDGTIYESLPGKLGVNFLNLNVGAGKKVNVAVSVSSDGTYSFSKADGTRYTDEELRTKGIDPSVISVGIDPATSLLKAYDAKTGTIISNNEFDATDTSNLSRYIIGGRDGLAAVNTDGSLTRNSIIAGIGETGSKLAGQTISTFSSVINGTTKAVVSLTGNVGSIGSGTFVPLSSAALGNDTALINISKSAAEAEAMKVCAIIPDRCEEAINAAK